MMKFKEVNGKDMIDDLFSTRDKQLEEEKHNSNHVDNVNQQGDKTKSGKPKKERKPRTPKKKN